MTLDRATMLMFLRAATPYSFEVTKAGVTETFTLDKPRELRFENGRIRLRVDCTGGPIPFVAELVPTLSIGFDREKNAFVIKVEELPVRIAPLGTIRLDKYLEPVEVPVTFTQPVDIGVPGLTVDTIVRQITVHENHIEARADLIFHRSGSPPPTAAGQ